ncbi:uncharacterized protein ACMZJ9_011507 [Mantella aurantiaca]
MLLCALYTLVPFLGCVDQSHEESPIITSASDRKRASPRDPKKLSEWSKGVLAIYDHSESLILDKQVSTMKSKRLICNWMDTEAKISNQGTRKPSSFLQKLTPHDDVEAYLTTFEWTAEREAWPQDQWAGILAPFLTGEPQRAYCDLPAAVAKDYTVLKGEILARLGVTPAVRAHRVHDWTFQPGRSPRSQMHDLLQLATKWLQPGQLTGTQIVERVAMDRYLRALPEALQRWVSLGDPNTLTQFVELVERYQVTEKLQRPPRPRGAA